MCSLFIVTLSQHIHTLVTLVLHLHNIFQLGLLDHFTKRNSLPNCEHDPSYQCKCQSNLVKAFFALHGEVVTGFFTYRRCSIKKATFKSFAIFKGKHLCWSLFLINEQGYKSVTFWQRDSNTSIFCEYCEKIFRTPILKDICQRLLLNFTDSKWK